MTDRAPPIGPNARTRPRRRVVVRMLAAAVVVGASLRQGARASATTSRAPHVLAALRSFAAFEAPLRRHGALVQADGGYRLALGSAPSGVWRQVGGTIDVRLPARAGAPLRIGLAGAQDVYIEVTAEGLRDAPGEVVDGALVTEGIAPDTDAVHVVDERRVEEVRLLWSARAPRRARYRIERGAGVLDVRVRAGEAGEDIVEVVDRAGRVRLQSAPMFAVDARGARCRVAVGLHADAGRWLLESTMEDCEAYPVAMDPVWSTTGSMTNRRESHTATLLASGKVLVAGGSDRSAFLSTAEVFDPTTEEWLTTDPMASRRSNHTATLIGGGKVLVAGGLNHRLLYQLSTAEMYDPTTDKWSGAAPMADRRRAHTATLLESGKVLVAGGGGGERLSTTEVYDPTTEKWSGAAPMADRRGAHTATLLRSGKVLVAGGLNRSLSLSTAEVYDPTTDKWFGAAPMADRRYAHTATLLGSGKVLVAGGFDRGRLSTAEVYDPTTERWSTTDPMAGRRSHHTATLLESGKVLVAGGIERSGYLSTAEVYDPTTEKWSTTDAMADRRGAHTATLVGSGKVLVAGGSRGEVAAFLARGKPCTSRGHCASLRCIDGVCCDRACAGQCEACDVPTKDGECVPVRGEPHGSRAACPRGDAPPCSAKVCDGATVTECTHVRGDVSCREAACKDGIATLASQCDGKGACRDPVTIPCGVYACDPARNACKEACVRDDDCAPRHACRAGVCVLNAAQCSPDRRIAIDVDGGETPCGAYRCGTDGRCPESCGRSDDCALGYACDLSLGKCLALERGGGAGGACALAGRAGGGGGVGEGGAALFALALGGALHRVRRMRRRAWEGKG